MATYYYHITGSDHSPWEGADWQETDGQFRPGTEPALTLGEEEKTELLKAFLDRIRRKNNIISKAPGRLGENTHDFYTYFNQKYYFGGYVGAVREKIRFPIEGDAEAEFVLFLTVKSRFDSAIEKPYFLTEMLLQSGVAANSNEVPSSANDFFDFLLTFWFRNKLQEAYQKGFYRTYQRFERNDDRLKGTIDIARHIRLNMGQNNGRIAYSFRENTVDNDLNRLVAAAYDVLRGKFPEVVNSVIDANYDTKKIIDGLKNALSHTGTHVSLLLARNAKPIAHPFYTEYEALRQVSVMILRNQGISIFESEGEESNGIFFYVPDLWELYLEQIFGRQGILSEAQGELPYFETAHGGWGNTARPDFVLLDRQTGSPAMILDAKFKPGWGGALTGKIPSSLTSDSDKCLRDMILFQVRQTGVIFPLEEDKLPARYKVRHRLAAGVDRYFHTIPVCIPNVGDSVLRTDWSAAFRSKVEAAVGEIRRALEPADEA